MIQLLVDVNIVGHVNRLVSKMRSSFWLPVWEHLDVHVLQFQDAGLDGDASDSEVYQVCQRDSLLLMTNNRNEDGPLSLETSVREHRSDTSLPIFTISDAGRLLHDRDYTERVIESLYDYLLRLDSILGSGRIYLP